LGKKVIEYFYGGGADIEMSSERFLIFDLRELDRLSSVWYIPTYLSVK
jgi:hypothetical protein